LERLLVVTITFPDDVKGAGEAYRRLHSFFTNIFSPRFPVWIMGIHRHKDGRIHAHLVVVVSVDVRTGFDFEAVKRRDYRSVGAWLRGQWTYFRDLTNYDGGHSDHRYSGIGRMELKPVEKDGPSAACYAASYGAKQLGKRWPEDRGVRLVRFSRALQKLIAEYLHLAELRADELVTSVRGMAQNYWPRKNRTRAARGALTILTPSGQSVSCRGFAGFAPPRASQGTIDPSSNPF
jgi:hypothetical protein